jgi:hypothetical protein
MSRADLEDIVFLILCIAIPAIIFGGVVVYKITEYESGLEAAEKYARRIPIVILLFVLGILAFRLLDSLIAESWRDILLLLCSIGFIISLIMLMLKRNRIKPDDILLTLGRVESKVMVFGGAIFLFGGLILLPEIYAKGRFNLDYLPRFSFSVTAGCYWLIISLSKVYVTKDGFSRFLGLIPWEQIASYEWGGQNNQILTITSKKRAKLSYQVPVQDKEALFLLMNEMSREAEAKGLTPEILESILNDDESVSSNS